MRGGENGMRKLLIGSLALSGAAAVAAAVLLWLRRRAY